MSFLNEIEENGKKGSPVLKPGMKNYLIDIDGTITEDVPNEDPQRMKTVLPFEGAVETCNKWYDEGHIITYFTSRTEDLRAITENWLIKHGFKFHHILMNKPRGGNYHWIDNHVVKTTQFKGKFTDFVTVQEDVEVFKD